MQSPEQEPWVGTAGQEGLNLSLANMALLPRTEAQRWDGGEERGGGGLGWEGPPQKKHSKFILINAWSYFNDWTIS